MLLLLAGCSTSTSSGDAGTVDAGETDGGDAGTADGGDAGTADAGTLDAGTGDGGPQFTYQSTGLVPTTLTVAAGADVEFLNSDLAPHQPASDPHPAHSTCPELNGPVLQSGQSFHATMGAGPKTCGFHDEQDPANTTFQGTVTVQ
jgi:plastocyanin